MRDILYIEDLESDELKFYSKLSEKELLRYNEPDPGYFIAESPKVITRALDYGYDAISLLVEDKHIEGEACELIDRLVDIPVYAGSGELLSKLTGFNLTRGALCLMRRKPLLTLEQVCKNAKRIAVLEGVVNPTNVGAIFRSAAALNMDAVILSPACCDPLYRRSLRVSMGTIFQIPWTFASKKESQWLENGAASLHKLGFKTAAMALTDKSVSIDDENLLKEEKIAIILGTEGEGLNQSTIDACDYTVKIPMGHDVDSLNVAAASTVAFWAIAHH